VHDPRSPHRFHRPHADRQGLSRRLQRDPSPTLASYAIRAAVERARIDPAEVDDVIMGAALQQGVQTTIGRTAALRSGLPSPSPASRSTANAPPA
jgi:acetyl-CoA acetyltransferase